jgi:hypothetical protein
MKITVTLRDIREGQKRDPEQCAVARALLRAGLKHSGVMGPSVMVSDICGRLMSLPLPSTVGDWIFDFDAGKTVRPISFEMDFSSNSAGGETPPRGCKKSELPQTSERTELPLLSPQELNSVARIRSNSPYKKPRLSHRRSRFSFKTHRGKRSAFTLV